jgi:hypothetical protein
MTSYGYHTNDVFDQPPGPIGLRGGKWWLNRASLGVGNDGLITILVADGYHCVEIVGTPDALRRLASGIEAHVTNAELNRLDEAGR